MAEWLPNTFWRQGHALTHADTERIGLKHPECPEDTIAIVISHDCDLTQPPIIEPNVEIILGREIHDVNNNYLDGKSSRTLHLPFKAGNDDTVIVELRATDKLQIAKVQFAEFDCQPCITAVLAPKQKRVLRRWLSARYFRAAFPDAFVTRFDKLGVDKRFKKIVAKAQSHISAIYFDLDRGTLEDREIADEGECYLLSVYLVHPIDPDPEVARKEAEVARASIEAMFEKRCKIDGHWRGIKLEGCYVLSTTEMSLEFADQLRKWHLDYISVANTPEGPIVDGERAAA